MSGSIRVLGGGGGGGLNGAAVLEGLNVRR